MGGRRAWASRASIPIAHGWLIGLWFAYVPTLWYMGGYDLLIFKDPTILAPGTEHRTSNIEGLSPTPWGRLPQPKRTVCVSRCAQTQRPCIYINTRKHAGAIGTTHILHHQRSPAKQCRFNPLCQLSEWHRSHSPMTGSIDNSPRKSL